MGQDDSQDEIQIYPKGLSNQSIQKITNLRQKILSVKEYTKEFYRLNIGAGQKENEDEKTTKYVNGMRYEIQEKINMMSISKFKDAYQAALKAEEKMARKQSQ